MNGAFYIFRTMQKADAALSIAEKLLKLSKRQANIMLIFPLIGLCSAWLHAQHDKEIENLRGRVRALEEQIYNQ